jgi:predicted metalloprotease
MEYFFNVIVPWIRDYSKATYRAMSEPSRWFYIKPGESGAERCRTQKGTQATYTEHSYEYCPTDKVIYVGQTAMWNYYLALGDAAPAVGLAHEWGHHVQTMVGINANTPAEIIRQEDQADCIAGAWSAYLVQREIMVDDDFGDVGQLLVAIGEAEGPGRTHGTAAERTESWKQGFTGAIRACSSFFPDHPLIT